MPPWVNIPPCLTTPPANHQEDFIKMLYCICAVALPLASGGSRPVLIWWSLVAVSSGRTRSPQHAERDLAEHYEISYGTIRRAADAGRLLAVRCPPTLTLRSLSPFPRNGPGGASGPLSRTTLSRRSAPAQIA